LVDVSIFLRWREEAMLGEDELTQLGFVAGGIDMMT